MNPVKFSFMKATLVKVFTVFEAGWLSFENLVKMMITFFCDAWANRVRRSVIVRFLPTIAIAAPPKP